MNILIDDIKKLIKKLALPAMIGTLFKLYTTLSILFLQEKYPEDYQL